MKKCPKCERGNDDNVNVCWFCNRDISSIECFYQPTPINPDKKLPIEIITTTHTIQNRAISEYLGIVSSEVVMGQNFLSEFFVTFTDFFGGRSSTYENTLKRAKDSAMSELKEQARDLGGNAVIGVSLQFQNLDFSKMLMIYATGTAVLLKEEDLNKAQNLK